MDRCITLTPDWRLAHLMLQEDRELTVVKAETPKTNYLTHNKLSTTTETTIIMNHSQPTITHLLPNVDEDGREVDKPNVISSSDPSKKRKPKLYNMLRVVATGKPFNKLGRRSSHSTQSPESGSHSTHATVNSSSSCEEDEDKQHRPNQQQSQHSNIRCESHRKCVTFATQGTARRTLSWREYSYEEIQATWYAQDEYTKIQKSCCKEIIKMDNGEVLKGKKYCVRGLECHTRTGRILKTRNKQGSVQAVLAEQGSQIRDCRTRDDAAIAFAYQQISSSCQLWARATGIADARDAEDVDDILGEEEDTFSPQSVSSSYSRHHQKHVHPSRRACGVESDGGQDFHDKSCIASMVARTA